MLDQAAVAMDPRADRRRWSARSRAAGYPVHRMTSGAGHDAMILAAAHAAAMLFLRSPGGISHHPDETVLPKTTSPPRSPPARAVPGRTLERTHA